MTDATWPYHLPIWRRHFRAVSPDGKLVAEINPAYEVSMSNPTSGLLCICSGLRLPRCNPSFIWSDDSAYLAVPQFFRKYGIARRQRLLVIAFAERSVHLSRTSAWYFQPESFVAGRLVVSINPSRDDGRIEFRIPDDLPRAFSLMRGIAWPKIPQQTEAV